MADGRMTAAAFLVAELRRARTRRGWSRDELAKTVNYSASMVSAVELGQQPPTAKYLELVDRALDTGGLRADPRVSLALPDPDAPLVAEGVATVARPPFRSDIVAGFRDKYAGRDITKDGPGGSFVLLRVSVTRWLLDGRTG